MNKHIVNIVTHYRSHQDELLAIWLLRRHGNGKFPGVGQAKIVFLEKELEKKYPDDIYVGVGYGEFDEHRPNGRLENTCAAMLVAQSLGITMNPRIAPLLADALWCDTKNEGVREARLANLVKAMHRVKKGKDQFGTYRFAVDAFDAITDGAKDHKFDVRAEWKRFVADKQLPQGDMAVRNVGRFINESFMRRDDHVTELAHIACRMDKDIVFGWLAAAFDTMIRDAQAFCDSVEVLKKHNPMFDIMVGAAMEPACVIESDCELINKAVNNSGCGTMAVLAVRRSSGNIQIFGDAKRKMDLTDLGAMIRMAEYKARTGRVFTFESARGEGTMKLCKVWHQPNPNTLLNGSLTHPGVEPSVLSAKDIEDILLHAFTESGRKLWIEKYMSNSNPGENPFEGESLEDLLSAQTQLAS